MGPFGRASGLGGEEASPRPHSQQVVGLDWTLSLMRKWLLSLLSQVPCGPFPLAPHHSQPYSGLVSGNRPVITYRLAVQTQWPLETRETESRGYTLERHLPCVLTQRHY